VQERMGAMSCSPFSSCNPLRSKLVTNVILCRRMGIHLSLPSAGLDLGSVFGDGLP